MSAHVGVHGEHVGGLSHPASPQCPPLAEPGVWGCWQSRNRVAVTAPVRPAEDRRGWLVSSSTGWCQSHCCWSQAATPPPDPCTPVNTLEVVPSAYCVQKTFGLPFSCRSLIRILPIRRTQSTRWKLAFHPLLPWSREGQSETAAENGGWQGREGRQALRECLKQLPCGVHFPQGGDYAFGSYIWMCDIWMPLSHSGCFMSTCR